jgi:SAM-dependent methyltransferase
LKKLVLNLGCGEKLIKSTEDVTIVNVDITVPQGAHKEIFNVDEDTYGGHVKPLFIRQNITDPVDIEENIVDEIIAIHVVEHIFPDELVGVLTEWKKLLKPETGILIVELPDVVKCAINLLQIFTSKDPKMVEHLGVKGLFGEYKDKNIYEAHKWGYTTLTLGPVFEHVGFTNIQEGEPEFHMGSVRDFRLIGVRPSE